MVESVTAPLMFGIIVVVLAVVFTVRAVKRGPKASAPRQARDEQRDTTRRRRAA